jgi:cytochrome c-type biogenesis protein
MFDLSLALLSFIAGILTVLAPCVLPLLPVIIGSSLTSKDKKKPYFVTLGLVVSITIFTILLKASTSLIGVDPFFWKLISGGIIFIFGLIYLFPGIWENISVFFKLSTKSDNLLNNTSKIQLNKSNWFTSMLVGGALGPVFASCSPTYSLIIATVLPANFYEGLVYIIIYAIGLAVVMLLVALLGRGIIQKLRIFANPNGWFKKTLGIIFVFVGLFIITGIDKKIETAVLNGGFFDITKLEQGISEKLKFKSL